ncbi:hypothetical protein AB0G15_42970 [Streptosporangium sp. NPDC023825]|uniref:hypothetical protein n=1 Tax=Streptosporangium sp. NPDC023825 TaxID=3154909 RepID=UPI003441B6D8
MASNGRTPRSSIGAPGFPLIGSLVVVGLLLLYGASFPSGNPLWVFPVLLAFFVLGVVWFGRLVVEVFNSEGRPGVKRNLLRWAAPAIVGILVFALAALGPGRFRFSLSEESFEKVARSAVAGSADWRMGATTLGLFEISWAERHEGTVRFALAGGGDGIYTHGFIWSPRGEPPLPEAKEYQPEVEHYYGPWYLWSANF